MNQRDELARLLFTLPVSNHAANTAPEIIALCESAAAAILAANPAETVTQWGRRGENGVVKRHDHRRSAQLAAKRIPGSELVTRQVTPWQVTK